MCGSGCGVVKTIAVGAATAALVAPGVGPPRRRVTDRGVDDWSLVDAVVRVFTIVYHIVATTAGIVIPLVLVLRCCCCSRVVSSSDGFIVLHVIVIMTRVVVSVRSVISSIVAYRNVCYRSITTIIA